MTITDLYSVSGTSPTQVPDAHPSGSHLAVTPEAQFLNWDLSHFSAVAL
jgi:hypothetical protein